MEIIELLKRANLHEWSEKPLVRAVPANAALGTVAIVSLEFRNEADAQKLVELLQK